MLSKKVEALVQELVDEVTKDKENMRAIILVRDERDGHTANLVAGDAPTLLAMLSKIGGKVMEAMLKEHKEHNCNGDCEHCDHEHDKDTPKDYEKKTAH